jgi:hypothetical protein
LGIDLEEAEALGHKEGPGVALEGFGFDMGVGATFGEEALAEGEELGSFVRLLVEEVSGEIGEGDGLGVSHGVAPVKFVLRGERAPTGESVAWGGAGDGGDGGEVIEGRGDKDFGICVNEFSDGAVIPIKKSPLQLVGYNLAFGCRNWSFARRVVGGYLRLQPAVS